MNYDEKITELMLDTFPSCKEYYDNTQPFLGLSDETEELNDKKYFINEMTKIVDHEIANIGMYSNKHLRDEDLFLRQDFFYYFLLMINPIFSPKEDMTFFMEESHSEIKERMKYLIVSDDFVFTNLIRNYSMQNLKLKIEPLYLLEEVLEKLEENFYFDDDVLRKFLLTVFLG